MKIVVDTSVFIDFSRSGKGLFRALLNESKEKDCGLYVSTISITEFWAGKSMQDKAKVKEAEKVFARMVVVPLDQKIAKTAGGLIRNNQSFGFDAIIAATALEIGAQVATSNIKHFTKVKNLKLYSK